MTGVQFQQRGAYVLIESKGDLLFVPPDVAQVERTDTLLHSAAILIVDKHGVVIKSRYGPLTPSAVVPAGERPESTAQPVEPLDTDDLDVILRALHTAANMPVDAQPHHVREVAAQGQAAERRLRQIAQHTQKREAIPVTPGEAYNLGVIASVWAKYVTEAHPDQRFIRFQGESGATYEVTIRQVEG